MTESLTVPPRREFQTFMDILLHTDLESLDAHVAVIGLPYGDPYTIDEVTNDQTNAPTAIRRESAQLSIGPDQFDYDVGGPMLDGRPIRLVDVGDVPGDARDLGAHFRKAAILGTPPIQIRPGRFVMSCQFSSHWRYHSPTEQWFSPARQAQWRN